MNTKNIVFNISGGVGKNIMATAVVSSIRKQYPHAHLIVTTPHTIVWHNNPHINECIDITKDTYFYRDHVKNKDVLFFGNDPYLHQNYIYKKEQLIQTWCKMFDITYNGSSPQLYFTKEETQAVRAKLPTGKLFFIQVSGGAPNQEFPISWTRDLPVSIGQDITNHMISKGYQIVQIRRKNQYKLEGAPWIDLDVREMMCALQFANKLLLIDSVAQHAAMALRKKAVVCWIGHDPKVLGYDFHTNITPIAHEEFRHHIDNYLDKYNMTGTLHECPYDTNELFDVERILKALEK